MNWRYNGEQATDYMCCLHDYVYDEKNVPKTADSWISHFAEFDICRYALPFRDVLEKHHVLPIPKLLLDHGFLNSVVQFRYMGDHWEYRYVQFMWSHIALLPMIARQYHAIERLYTGQTIAEFCLVFYPPPIEYSKPLIRLIASYL